MKLEMSLPERPSLLHAVPVFNIFALLLLFFLLGPSFVLQSGVTVEVPPSRFQMERFEDTLVVTLAGDGENTGIHLGREPVTLEELGERLEKLRDDGAPAKTIVLLKTDGNTPVRDERLIGELILSKGFRLGLVGQNHLPQADLPAPEPDAE